jgi:23S rRNA (uracil1939-C5)-methyltransferase
MQVEIQKLTFGGQGIGRANGKVVFVNGGLPGETLRIKITKDKGKYAEASIEEVLRASPERTQAPCPVFGICGGCQWQHIKYSFQISAKEQILRETLERIGGLKETDIESIVPSPREYGYRNRVTLSAWFEKGGNHIGYHEEGSRRRVQIQGCPIASKIIDEAIFRLAKLLSSLDTPLYSLKKVHIASDESSAYVSLVPLGDGNPKELKSLRDAIKKSLGLGFVSFAGSGEEEFEFTQSGLKFYSTPSVFIQSNRKINERLIETLIEWAELKGHERVLDLYCGVGNFSLHLAKRAKELVGVDVSAKAVKLAKKSAEANEISNVLFDSSPAELFVEESLKCGDKFDLVILDPPREGAKEILKGLVELSPNKIIYVSCDPPTLARDLKTLTQMGYRVLKIRPFDMFPETYHIESIALIWKA